MLGLGHVAERGAGEPIAPAVQRAVITIGGQAAQQEEEEDGIKPLPDRLITELTAHRTPALRDAVANNPHVVMTALLHKLVSDAFLHRPATGTLEATVRHTFFSAQSDELKDSPPNGSYFQSPRPKALETPPLHLA